MAASATPRHSTTFPDGRSSTSRTRSSTGRQTSRVLDLVSRSKKPVQELAWASIGNVLTAIQICEAHDRGVLVPWNSWRHEFYKPMGTLHDADRGGFIFAPEVGLHENVHELDFSSLYPNIICTRNVSPDVIRCDCHSDRDDVPGLGYSICDDRGYLVDVLQPIIDARDEIKAAIRREKDRNDPDEDRLAELEGRSGALKWILVACFGYQGFSNAKFGRIECHEAINAFAREILLTAKQRLEAGGWRVVHGIVDSIWVTPDPDVNDEDREDLQTLATEITERVEIRLEHEAHYDWVAFVPQRESDTGATQVLREGRRRRRLQDTWYRSPAALNPTVHRGRPAGLSRPARCYAVTGRGARTARTSNRRTAGGQRSSGAACRAEPCLQAAGRLLTEYPERGRLEASPRAGSGSPPGTRYRVCGRRRRKSSRDRVALAHEAIGTYAASYYETQLVRAIESVLLPLGWDRTDIRRRLARRHGKWS